MSQIYNNSGWGRRASAGTIITPAIAAPTAATNSRGIQSAVGRRAPVPISMRRMPMSIARKTPAPIIPAILPPDEEDLAPDARETAARMQGPIRRKLARPTRLLSERIDVSFAPLPPAEEDLVNEDTKKAAAYKGVESITAADISAAVGDSDPLARQIKAFELITKTRPLTIDETATMNQLKGEFLAKAAEGPAKLVQTRQDTAMPDIKELAQEKAIDDAVAIEAEKYLREKLAAERELERKADDELGRMSARSKELAQETQTLTRTMNKLQSDYGANERKLARIESELEDMRNKRDEIASERDELAEVGEDDADARQAAARIRKLNELSAKLDEREEYLGGELRTTTDYLRSADAYSRNLGRQIGTNKLRAADYAKQRESTIRKYKLAASKLASAPPGEKFLTAAEKFAAPRRQAGDLEVYLRRIVGPVAAARLTSRGVQVDEEKEEEEEEEEEPIGLAGLEEPRELLREEPRELLREEPRELLREEKAPRRKSATGSAIDIPTPEELVNTTDAELGVMLKTVQQDIAEVKSSPAYDYSEEERQQILAGLVTKGEALAQEQAAIHGSSEINKRIADMLNTKEKLVRWSAVNAQPKKTKNMTADDKAMFLGNDELIRMYKALKRDYGNTGLLQQAPFDINRNAGKKGPAQAAALPNASKKALAYYLANNLHVYR